MAHPVLHVACALALAGVTTTAASAVVSFSGALGNPGNTALVASDLGAAQFTDNLATANNVALHRLQLSVGGTVEITSTGHAAGGIDPYVTLFRGTDPGTATWVASNYDHASTLGGDFTQGLVLGAGDYTLAIGVYLNMSFAENLGSGVLADGFIGLGQPTTFGDGGYALSVSLPDASVVPEPGGAGLALTALLAAAALSRARGVRCARRSAALT